jgi:hypothetical protein
LWQQSETEHYDLKAINKLETYFLGPFGRQDLPSNCHQNTIKKTDAMVDPKSEIHGITGQWDINGNMIYTYNNQHRHTLPTNELFCIPSVFHVCIPCLYSWIGLVCAVFHLHGDFIGAQASKTMENWLESHGIMVMGPWEH